MNAQQLFSHVYSMGYEARTRKDNNKNGYVEVKKNGKWVVVDDSLRLEIDISIASRELSEKSELIRDSFFGRITQYQIAEYQTNSQILDLIDSGEDISNLDACFKQKIQIQLENDPRFKNERDLLSLWREKRKNFLSVLTFINSTEKTYLNKIKAAKSNDDIYQLLSEFDKKIRSIHYA